MVDNRPGASGVIGYELIAKGPPDGYTLGYTTFAIATIPSMFSKLPYNAARDFQMVVQQVTLTNLLSSTTSLPASSVQELIDHARGYPTSYPLAAVAMAPASTLGWNCSST